MRGAPWRVRQNENRTRLPWAAGGARTARRFPPSRAQQRLAAVHALVSDVRRHFQQDRPIPPLEAFFLFLLRPPPLPPPNSRPSRRFGHLSAGNMTKNRSQTGSQRGPFSTLFGP